MIYNRPECWFNRNSTPVVNPPTWAQASLPIDSCWEAVTYGAGKFVALNRDPTKGKTGAYSTNGLAWQQMTLPGGDWASVVYGNGKFVAISAFNGVAAYSANGISWTKTSMPQTDYYWKHLLYYNGTFVAASAREGAIAYSTNGTKWTMATPPSGFTISYSRPVIHNGKFMIFGTISDKPAMAYSTNGINWSSEELSSNVTSLGYIASDGSGKLAMVKYNSDAAYYSTDGINWTSTTMSSSSSWQSIIYGYGLFMAVCNRAAKAAYSADGIHWVEGDLPVIGDWDGMAYGDGKFVLTDFANGSSSGSSVALCGTFSTT